MRIVPKKGWVPFLKDLKNEVSDDNVDNGAAALAFYLMLSIFPALIALLTIIPFLPIADIDTAIMDFMRQTLPGEAATLISGVVEEVTTKERGGLLSIGLIAAIWAASKGFYAIMQQMNVTYDVKETRGMIKSRVNSLIMLGIFTVLIIGGFALVVFGGVIQEFLQDNLNLGPALLTFFAIFRWVIIFGMSLLAFSTLYYFGPNTEQKFQWVSPGSVVATVLLALATLGFSVYVKNFGNYSETFGSIGAVIVLLMWLYIAGWVLMLGAEVNAILQAYDGKQPQKEDKVGRQTNSVRRRRPATQS